MGQGDEFEVEDILKYRRNENGEEHFLVKWVGYPVSEATWEPLGHMNENCRELVAKARALFAWRRPNAAAQAPPAVEEVAVSYQVRQEDEADAPSPGAETPAEAEAEGDGVEDADMAEGEKAAEEDQSDAWQRQQLLRQRQRQLQREREEDEETSSREVANITIDDGDTEDDNEGQTIGELTEPQGSEILSATKRTHAELTGPVARGPSPKRPKPPPPPPPAGPLLIPLNSHGGAAASQPKRQSPVLPSPPPAPAANGAVRPSPTTVTPPPPPKPSGEGKRVPSREMKCLCGSTEQLGPNADRGNLITCHVCNCSLHPTCVASHKRGADDTYNCATCRLERVDEFHPIVGVGLLKHEYASSSSSVTLAFNAQAAQWKKQSWAVHLRCVTMTSCDLTGPAWPHKVTGKLNGRQCVVIDPPKHLHVRREQCYNLTPLLRQGMNSLELRFTPRPDRPRDEAEESYCVGVVLTRPRSIASILSRIKGRSTETVTSGKLRVQRLITQVKQVEQTQEDECKVTGNFGRTLRPLCPVSHCPIEEAAIGRHCNHVQVFDLQAYIAVNQRMRSLDKRWTCPVCSLALRPDDIILDPFAQGILDTMRGDEDLVEAIVFNEDCSWSTISAVKDEKGGPDEENREKPSAELIDLSDSE